MITNIFDLFSAAGLPDPRKDLEFRKALLSELKRLENNENLDNNDQDDEEKPFEGLSVSNKIEFLKKALYNIEKNPSGAQRNMYANKLIEIYNANIDIKKIMSLTPKELDNLTNLPLRR